MPSIKLKLADIAFLGVASLERANPSIEDFAIRDVLQQVETLGLPTGSFHPASLSAHLSLHCIGNKRPDGGSYCMLYSPSKARVRLIRPSDDIHPLRTGKRFPVIDETPEEYHDLVVWAKQRYDSAGGEPKKVGLDALLHLEGKFRYTSEGQTVAEYVRELRSDWE